MDAFGQCQHRPSGAAARIDHQRPLLSNRALGGGVIERNHGDDWRTEMPGDFGTAVVEARVMAIQNELHVVAVDPQLPFKLIQRGPRVPQPDQIRGGYEQQLWCAGQHGAMIGRGDVGP